jgi:ArsR family transcriptional regulator
MNVRSPAIFEHLALLADTTRSRVLLLLDRHELTVSEICAIMQLPQSTVSRHLKSLAGGGWIVARAEGTSRLYAMARADELEGPTRRLWQLVREQVAPSPAAVQDARRLQSALAGRRSKSQEFFSSSAGRWDRLRDELFGDRFHLTALGGLASPEWVVGDLGCGTGRVTSALAPFVLRVVAVDSSAEMLQWARKRLRDHGNVDVRRGELEALPIDDGRLDAAMVMLVLHHVPQPGDALREVARVLKPDGRVVVVDMLPHDREGYRQQMGHVWLGFGEDHMRLMLDEAGFEQPRISALPPDSRAKGPGLFVATAKKSNHEATKRVGYEGTKHRKTKFATIAM